MKKQKKHTPRIRFPEYTENWETKQFGELATRIVNPVDVEAENEYQQVGIRSHGKGLFYKEPVLGKTLGSKRVFWIKENALIVNIVFAWEQAIAKTSSKEIGMIASHRFPMYLPNEKVAHLDYLLNFFLTNKGKKILELASPGGAGRNKTLGQKEFEKSRLRIPSYKEQVKIASFLTLMNKRLSNLKQKKNYLKLYKRGVTHQIFTQKVRFRDGRGKKYPAWESKKLGDCLDYLQPTKYLVSSTDYKPEYNTPVLTAGKKFILGYTDEQSGVFDERLPVIIFDDFTTASQFVDFPFKAKSSAMKILKAKNEDSVKFLFEAMQMIKYKVKGHGRHWISVFSNIDILMPCTEEQLRIADFLSAIDRHINIVDEQIRDFKKFKDSVIQGMIL